MPEESPSNERESLVEAYTPASLLQTGSIIEIETGLVVAELNYTPPAPEFVPDPVLAERVREAVVAAARRDAKSMRELRLAINGFTIALREMGTTPERVLIALKTVINNRSLIAIPIRDSDQSGEYLRQQISTWCIEEFFRTDAG